LSSTVFPGVDYTKFCQKSLETRLTTIQNDHNVSAVYDEVHRTFMAVFWKSSGGSVHFTPFPYDAETSIATSGNLAVIYQLIEGNLTVADPSQTLQDVRLNITTTAKGKGSYAGPGVTDTHRLSISLPQGGFAGNSVSCSVSKEGCPS